jgi:hypothetical protein
MELVVCPYILNQMQPTQRDHFTLTLHNWYCEVHSNSATVTTYQDLFWRVSCGRTRGVGRRCAVLAWQDTAHHHEVAKWTHSLLAAPLRTDDQLELPVPSKPVCTTPVPQPLLKFDRILQVPVPVQNGKCMDLTETQAVPLKMLVLIDYRQRWKSILTQWFVHSHGHTTVTDPWIFCKHINQNTFIPGQVRHCIGNGKHTCYCTTTHHTKWFE